MAEANITSSTRQREIREIQSGYYYLTSTSRVHRVGCEFAAKSAWASRIFLKDDEDARQFLGGRYGWRNCGACGGAWSISPNWGLSPVTVAPSDSIPPGESVIETSGSDLSTDVIEPSALPGLQQSILDEILKCRQLGAYRASIVLSATLLEKILRSECERRGLKGELQGGEPPTLGYRIKQSRTFLKDRATRAAYKINEFRNLIVHANEPEEEQIEKADAEEVWACLQRFLANPFK